MSKTMSVMLAAGGTGGHLFPAYALAEELERRGIDVDLATDMRGDRYGSGFPARTIYRIPSATLSGRSPFAYFKTITQLVRGTFSAWRILGRNKPSVVLGFGGYPTYPPLLAARLRGIPTAVHEQNAVLGRANRMLAGRVDRIAMTFEMTKLLPASAEHKVRITGNPVRAAVQEAANIAYPEFSPDAQLRLVVFGGSQGARFLSDAVPAALVQLPDAVRERLHVTQQAREEDVSRVEETYRQSAIASDVATFFANLPDLIAKAHLVIARSGASTVAELRVIGRPALLVPLPGSLDNDQLENARRLAESGSAWCIEQKDLTDDRLARELALLLTAPETLKTAAATAKTDATGNAVARLADVVEELMQTAR